MTPLEYVKFLFGGVRPVARVLNIEPGNVVGWTKRKNVAERGQIPSKYHVRLLEEAKNRNLELTPDQLIYGK